MLSGCGAAKTAAPRPVQTAQIEYYVIQPGDTLSEISSIFDTSLTELKLLNGLSNPNKLSIGQRLIVPGFTGFNFELDQTFHPWEKARISKKLALPTVRRSAAKRYLGQLDWPVAISKIKVSSGYGPRRRRMHEGIDIPARSGTAVRAAHNGRVVLVKNRVRGYGKVIMIQGQGIMTVYGHNRHNRVRPGQAVVRGQKIADVGMTGRATGPHLHFETRVKTRSGKAATVDPLVFFARS